MEAQYLKNNHVTYYVITQGGVYTEQWYVIITSDVTWTAGQIKVPELESKLVVHSSKFVPPVRSGPTNPKAAAPIAIFGTGRCNSRSLG